MNGGCGGFLGGKCAEPYAVVTDPSPSAPPPALRINTDDAAGSVGGAFAVSLVGALCDDAKIAPPIVQPVSVGVIHHERRWGRHQKPVHLDRGLPAFRWRRRVERPAITNSVPVEGSDSRNVGGVNEGKQPASEWNIPDAITAFDGPNSLRSEGSKFPRT